MKRRVGIQQKFVTLVIVLLVSIAVFIALFFPQRQKLQMNKYLNEKILVTAQMIAFNASTGMMFEDTEAVKKTLDVLPTLSGVKYVSIRNLKGEEIAGYKADSTYKKLLATIPQLAQEEQQQEHHVIVDVDDVALYSEPIIYQGQNAVMRSSAVGKVVVGISRTELTNDALESLLIALGSGFAILILGGVIMFISTGRLVSPLKKLSRAAGRVSAGNLDEAVNITTNDEVEILANAFNRMVGNIRNALQEVQSSLKKAEEANARKTELLSIVSHDLKSPLSSVLAAIKLIELGDITEEEFPEVGSRIRELCERMIELIESLLASSAMEMGTLQVEKENCNAKEIMEKVTGIYRQNAEAKSQNLQLIANGENFELLADKGLIRQVLENFVTNAIKYSDYGKTIIARVVAHPEIIRFEVQDEGPGLTPEDQQKLFGFFQRLSAKPTGGESSHGVGLAITKRVVDLHHGKIWVESEVGKGTNFIVELPRLYATNGQ